MERPSAEVPATSPTPRPPEPVQRWRLTFRRRRDAPVVAQREWQGALEAALVATGLPIAMTEAGGLRPRIAIAAPLAQGMAAERELVELFLVRRLPIWEVRAGVTAALPPGDELVDLEDVWLGEAAIAGRVIAADYEVDVPGDALASIAEGVHGIVSAPALPRTRVRGDRTVEYDLRPFVETLELGGGSAAVLRMRLRHDPEKGVGRPEEVLAELGDRIGVRLDGLPIVRTELVLAPLKSASSRASDSSAGPRAGGGPRPPRRPR